MSSNIHTNHEYYDRNNDHVKYMQLHNGQKKIKIIINGQEFTKKYIKLMLSPTAYDNATIFAKFCSNNVKAINRANNTEWYCWDNKMKLWKHNNKNSTIMNNCIVESMRSIVTILKEKKAIDPERAESMFKYWGNLNPVSQLNKFDQLRHDEVFAKRLNVHPMHFPLKHGKKIDLLTKEISDRTKQDYWSFELKYDYHPRLPENENKFAQFLRSIWTNNNEYEFIKLLIGYMILPDNDESIVTLMQHKLGGSGKTIFIDILHHTFPNLVCSIDRNAIFYENAKLQQELLKIKNKRICYIDEALEHKKNQDGIFQEPKSMHRKKEIKLGTVLRISGGGSFQIRELYRNGDQAEPYHIRAKLLLLGNDNSFNFDTHPALNRRMIFCAIQTYFRNPGEPNYNANDHHCKRKKKDIKKILENNKGDVVTFVLNCAHEFLAGGKPSLLFIQPSRFKKAWKATYDKLGKFIKFCTTKCILDKCLEMPLPQFQKQLKLYTNSEYTYEIIEKFISSSGLELNIIYKSKNNGIRQRHVAGCKLKKQHRIYSHLFENDASNYPIDIDNF